MVIVITQWFQDFLKSKKTSMIIYLYTKIYTTSSVHSCTGVFLAWGAIVWLFKMTVYWKFGFEIKGINYGLLQFHRDLNPETTAYKTDRNRVFQIQINVKFLNIILIGKYRTYRWQCLIVINTPFTQHWLFGRA